MAGLTSCRNRDFIRNAPRLGAPSVEVSTKAGQPQLPLARGVREDERGREREASCLVKRVHRNGATPACDYLRRPVFVATRGSRTSGGGAAMVTTRWSSTASVTPTTSHVTPARTRVSPASGSLSVVRYSQLPSGKRSVMASSGISNDPMPQRRTALWRAACPVVRATSGSWLTSFASPASLPRFRRPRRNGLGRVNAEREAWGTPW